MRESTLTLDYLMDAEENADKKRDYLIFNLLISQIPRGEMFIGKHGTGLMTAAEFVKVVEQANQAGQLSLRTHSAAFLDESIDFG